MSPNAPNRPLRQLLNGAEMTQLINRMAERIVAAGTGPATAFVIVGIRTRGLPLAERLATEIGRLTSTTPPIGALDITLYRDDLSTIAPQPVVKSTYLPTAIDDSVVVLCDDVLYTGRTVRAALSELADYGRPRAVRLAVLIDRGHRELPIQGDFVGSTIETRDDELVVVAFEETDGEDFVALSSAGEGSE